jgi:ABC-type dipeptide/oligopeptide/nickel transport system permease component
LGSRWRQTSTASPRCTWRSPAKQKRRGLIIAGAFVIENIFSIAGIGRYFVVAVQARDDGVVMGLTVVITLTIIVGNLVVDVVYALLDPRQRDRR